MFTKLSKIVSAIILIAAVSFSLPSYSKEPGKEAEIKISSISKDDKTTLETIVLLLKGVNDVNIKSEVKILVVNYNPELISTDMIIFTIKHIGYNAELNKDVDIVSNE